MNHVIGSCVGCLKVNHNLFNELSNLELESLNSERKKYFYKKGELIFKEKSIPPGLICLSEGKVKLVKEGKIEDEFIVGLAKMGDFLGFDNLMSDSEFTYSAIAIEDVVICVIEKERLFEIIDQNPKFSTKIIHFLSQRIISQNQKMIILTQSKLESRLAYTLVDLINFFGFEEDGITLAVQLKRKEIASLSSMNTSNVIRMMSHFNKLNIIKTKLRRIQILKLDVIRNMIE